MRHTALLTVTFILILSSMAVAGDQVYGDVTVSKILRVYDGDTFYASINRWPAIIGKNIGVRVAGIDTPEVRTKNEKEKQLA